MYYRTLGIARSDANARTHQTMRDFSFCGAPVSLVFSIDARLRPHSWLDLGLFIRDVVIAVGARGSATCPQCNSPAPIRQVASRVALPEIGHHERPIGTLMRVPGPRSTVHAGLS